MLQIERFRRTRKLIENGGPNGIKKSSKLKPWASKVWFFEILMDLGKLVFSMFLGGWHKTGQQIKKHLIWGEFWIQIIIQIGPLSSGLGCFSWHCIPLLDNAWHRPVSADFGTHWILSQKGAFFMENRNQHEIRKVKSQKGFRTIMFVFLIFDAKWQVRNCKKEVFTLYLLITKIDGKWSFK